MDYKVLIATHKNYIDKTNIVANLQATGIPDEKTVFVVSGSDGESNERFLHSPRNFWEYNALLTATEYVNAPEYWLLIHDTVLFGSNFYNEISKMEFQQSFDIVSINPANQFNIGYYKHSFLVEQKDYIASLEGMTRAEGIKVEVEARIRNKSNNVSYLMNDDIYCNRKLKVWGEIEREEFYIPPLDLYKYLVYVGGSPLDKTGYTAIHPEKP